MKNNFSLIFRSVLILVFLSSLRAHDIEVFQPLIEDQKMIASDGQGGDFFGRKVAFDGQWAIIGASAADPLGANSGAAYLFRKVSGVWQEETKLLASDGAQFDTFGLGTSILGDWLAIGSSGYQDNGGVYLYQNQSGNWVEVAILTSSDGLTSSSYGSNVLLVDDLLFVGASLADFSENNSGAVYIYRRSGDQWSYEATLAPDPIPESVNDYFGVSFDYDKGLLLVGAYEVHGGLEDAEGKAYIYRDQGDGTWLREQIIEASDPLEHSRFGLGTGISGDTIAIGAYGTDDFGNNSGAVYIFENMGGVWQEVEKLIPSDSGEFDNFGYGVFLESDFLVVSAIRDTGDGDSDGSIYTFRRFGGVWTEEAKLIPSDATDYDSFGTYFDVDGERILSGAYFQSNENGIWAGSVYYFKAFHEPTIQMAQIANTLEDPITRVRATLSGGVNPAGLTFVLEREMFPDVWQEVDRQDVVGGVIPDLFDSVGVADFSSQYNYRVYVIQPDGRVRPFSEEKLATLAIDLDADGALTVNDVNLFKNNLFDLNLDGLINFDDAQAFLTWRPLAKISLNQSE